MTSSTNMEGRVWRQTQSHSIGKLRKEESEFNAWATQ